MAASLVYKGSLEDKGTTPSICPFYRLGEGWGMSTVSLPVVKGRGKIGVGVGLGWGGGGGRGKKPESDKLSTF